MTDEPVFAWQPVLFLLWAGFVVVGAWITATMKARSDEHRHGFHNWLVWFGGLVGVGMALGMVFALLVGLYRLIGMVGDRLPAGMVG